MPRSLRWPYNTGDWILYVLTVLIVAFAVTQSVAKGEDIDFSIHKATPIAQTPPKDADDAKISIFQMEPIEDEEDLIGFSVHNAKPWPKPNGDVGDARPDCSEARMANRVLLVLDTSKRVEQRNAQICERGKPCRWVLQNVDVVISPASQALSKELGKLDKNWKVGEDECVHFKVVEFGDPRNVDLVKDLQIKASDLPLLIKESAPDRRKKAGGMSAKNLMDWWNQQFGDPVPVQAVSSGVPFHSGHNCPKCGRMQYDIHNNAGPVSNSHIHRCDFCGTSWYHGDNGQAVPHLTTPAKIIQTEPRASRGLTPRNVSFGYSKGSFQSEVANYALAVAQQTARAPPSRASFSSDPKKAAKEEKKWKEKERERIRKEVRRKVWSRYATFDPFTWLTIIQIIIQVLNFIFNQYGLN